MKADIETRFRIYLHTSPIYYFLNKKAAPNLFDGRGRSCNPNLNKFLNKREAHFADVLDGEDYYGGIVVNSPSMFLKNIVKMITDWGKEYRSSDILFTPYLKFKSKLRPGLFRIEIIGKTRGHLIVTGFWKEIYEISN